MPDEALKKELVDLMHLLKVLKENFALPVTEQGKQARDRVDEILEQLADDTDWSFLKDGTAESYAEQFTTGGFDQLNPPRNPEAKAPRNTAHSGDGSKATEFEDYLPIAGADYERGKDDVIGYFPSEDPSRTAYKGEADNIDWTEDKPEGDLEFYCPLCHMTIEKNATYDGVFQHNKQLHNMSDEDAETLAKGFTYSNNPPTSDEANMGDPEMIFDLHDGKATRIPEEDIERSRDATDWIVIPQKKYINPDEEEISNYQGEGSGTRLSEMKLWTWWEALDEGTKENLGMSLNFDPEHATTIELQKAYDYHDDMTYGAFEASEPATPESSGDWFDNLDYEKQKSILRRASTRKPEWELFYQEVTNLENHWEELYWDDIPSDLQWHIETEVRNSWESKANEGESNSSCPRCGSTDISKMMDDGEVVYGCNRCLNDDSISPKDAMFKATEGGQGSGRKYHQQWMNPADKINSISPDNMKRAKFLERANEIATEYSDEKTWKQIFEALKD